jgi:hypothetical protein
VLTLPVSLWEEEKGAFQNNLVIDIANLIIEGNNFSHKKNRVFAQSGSAAKGVPDLSSPLNLLLGDDRSSWFPVN